MRQVALTSCMDTLMSETTGIADGGRAALPHAGEVAQWVVVLLGWLWLGEQGMRLGWSLASGVLLVALWWAARLVCRGSDWALLSAPAVVGWCGLLTACGIWLPDLLPSQGTAHAGLLAVAVLWGLWRGLIETRSRVGTFQLGPVAWHPVLAACLVGLAWRVPGGESGAHMGVSMLLALGAAVLHARDRATAGRVPTCRGPRARLQTSLAPSAMGLMMGSLWLGNTWCARLGLTTADMVVAHLVLMAGLPSLVALLLHNMGQGRLSSVRQTYASLALLAMGALMLLGNSAMHGVLAMLLPSLAWAVHCNRHNAPARLAGRLSTWAARSMALLLGPVLLIWVGVASPLQGPWAMQSALALLGGLAVWQMAVLWWRAHAANATLSAT